MAWCLRAVKKIDWIVGPFKKVGNTNFKFVDFFIGFPGGTGPAVVSGKSGAIGSRLCHRILLLPGVCIFSLVL